MKKSKKGLETVKGAQTISCPKCNTKIDIAAILDAQVTESVDLRLKTELKKQEKEFHERELAIREELEEDREKDIKKIQEQLEKKILKEGELKTKALQQELAEKDKKIDEFSKNELELRKKQRELEEQKRTFKVEVERKMDKERKKIQEEISLKIAEEHHQKELQMQKQLSDVTKQLEEAKRKAGQGSMQNQGEVFELALEESLGEAFVLDQIDPVGKGVSGADIHQKIFDRSGKACGLIVWETKQTKSWSDKWVDKLKDDLLTARGEVGVIVTTVLPENIVSFGQVDGIWVTNFQSAVPLATALRQFLIENTKVRGSVQGKNEKMEAMYSYLSGAQFRQRVETIIKSFAGMKEDLDREKMALTKIWAKREKQISRVLDNTVGMYGDMQGLMGGSALPELPEADLIAISVDDGLE